MTSPYRDLAYLLAAYLHQDYDIIHGDEWAALEAFVARNPATAERVPRQVAQLLQDFPEESDVQTFAAEAGCAYLPEGQHDPYRTWLSEVAKYIQRRLAPNRD